MPPHEQQQQQQQQQHSAQPVGASTTTAGSELEQPLLSSSSSATPSHGPSSSTAATTTNINDDNHNDDHNHDDSKNIVIGNWFRMNHNVFLNLVLAVLYGISNSLWNGTAYAAYLKKLGGNTNAPLGNIEAASGAASLVTALPIGYLADKMGRSKIIRVGGMLLLLTCILQITVMEWVGTNEINDNDDGDDNNNSTYHHHYYNDDDISNIDNDETDNDSYYYYYYYSFVGKNWRSVVSSIMLWTGDDQTTLGKSSNNSETALWIMGFLMVLWGLADGVVGGPCQALFADSVPEGNRTSAYNILFICYCAASACGPLVSIILFETLGDSWDLYHLRMVIYIGLGLEIFNSFLMMLFDDTKALDEDEDNNHNQEESDDDDDDDGTEANTSLNRSNDDSYDEETLTSLQKRQRWIPYLVFAQGLIFAIGSGMTVKFFPLFFKDEVGMTPSQVQIIYTIVPAVMIVASTLCTKISGSGFGRVQTMLLFSIFGVSLLYAMVFFKSYLDDHPFLLVPIYVMRTALMNATYPIQESILMDFVPKNERARWKSLDNVASFGWCGSAAFGGWLADKFDYTYTFLITAILQTVGVFVWSLLLPLVPRKEGTRTMEEEEEQQDGEGNDRQNGTVATTAPSVVSQEDSMTQPLLTVNDSPDADT